MANRFYLLYYNYAVFLFTKINLQIAALILLHLRPFNLRKTVVKKNVFKKPTVAAKGILWSSNEIFLFSASFTFPQNRSIPLFSPRYVGEHPALEPIQEDQSPLALWTLFSLLCSRVLPTQMAGAPETTQVSAASHSSPVMVKKDFFWRREHDVVQPEKSVLCTLFPHTQISVDRWKSHIVVLAADLQSQVEHNFEMASNSL